MIGKAIPEGMNEMVTAEQWLIFVIAALVVVIAPGPDILGTLSFGLSKGKYPAMGYAAGCALGCLTHTLWAVLGVSAIVAASELAFTILKYAGAAYLIYLGIVSLRSQSTELKNDALPAEQIRGYLFRGFLSNAINPKVALFFLAFLPQFINSNGSAAMQIAILGLTFAILTAIAFITIGYYSGLIGNWLREKPWISRLLDRTTGCLFIGLGLKLAFSQRRV